VLIRKVNFATVQRFAKQAAKEHVSITDTNNTIWFIGEINDEIVAIAGLIQVAYGMRIKGVYVLPEYRAKGYGNELTQYLFELCHNRCSNIEVFAYNPNFYEHHGFKRFGSLPNGAIKLRRAD